jgi:hypothetical protein
MRYEESTLVACKIMHIDRKEDLEQYETENKKVRG